MDLKDMFKKPEEKPKETKTEEVKPEETKPEEEAKQGKAPVEEEDFEAKSAKLAQAIEDAREGLDLGDIPAREDHPYHLAVNAHRLHESKRKK